MAEFAYNNAKNANIGKISFELNYGYYTRIFYKKNNHPYFKSKLTDEL